MTGTPAVLEWLTGAWVRTARAYGDGPPGECSDVVWVQAGPWFADFRLPRPGAAPAHPFDQSHAFSGVLEVRSAVDTSATVAWRHDLDTDSRHDDTPDAGQLALAGGLLVESGDGYVEWWSRPSAVPGGPDPSAGAWVVEHRDPAVDTVDARMVCADGMAVAVWAGEHPGGAWCDPTSGWAPTRLTGPGCPGDLAEVASAAAGGGPLPDGWCRPETG
jgi:hypothetical protein